MKRMTMDKTSEDVLNEMDNLDKLYKKYKSGSCSTSLRQSMSDGQNKKKKKKA